MLHHFSFIMMLLLIPSCLYSANQTPLMLKLDDCGVSILVEKENDSFRLPTFHTLIHKTKVTEDSLHVGNIPGRKIILSNNENSDLSKAPDCQWIHTSQFGRKRNDSALSVKNTDGTLIPLDDDFARIITIYKLNIIQSINTIKPPLVQPSTQPEQPQSLSYQIPTHQHVGILYFSTNRKNNVHLLLTKVGKRQKYGITTEIYDPKKKSFDAALKTLKHRTNLCFADNSSKSKSILESHTTELSSNTTSWSSCHFFPSEKVIFNIFPLYIPHMIALKKKNAWVPLNNHYPLETKTRAFLKRYGDMLHVLAQHHNNGK